MAEDSKDGMPSGENPTPGATTDPTPVGSPGDFLDIKAEPQRATLTIKSGIVFAGFTLTRDHVAQKLQSLLVVEGIDWAAVDRMIAGKQYDRGQIIAQAIPAKPSQDAAIRPNLTVAGDLKPMLDKAGKADYKNVDNIHQVKKGDVLAVKTPAIQGTEGKDIFGKPLPAAAAKDTQFKLGSNTIVSEDGLQLVALVGGYVYDQSGAICVGVTYVLKGNVDFHTGNLHYQGDIQVLGNVTDGFTVEAEGNITIEGTVEGAEVISHGGAVHIKSGVFGHGKGRIAAKTGIRILGAQDVTLECEEGTIEVDKGIRNCHVLAKHVKADKAGCSVVGGEIRAYGDVSLGILGGEGCHTHILILDKDAEAAKARIKEIEHMKAQIESKFTPIETRLKGMKAMLAKFSGTMSERAKADLKGVADAYTALKKAEHDLEEEKVNLTSVMKAAPKHVGTFAVTEKIVWGGVVQMYGHLHELVEEDAKKEWLWAPTGLTSRSLIPDPPAETPNEVKPDEKGQDAKKPASTQAPPEATPPS
ncbi:MAG: FapA family protein [Fibrobacterota bacterium]|nr:FapA family protein [Fibrobacterota bacterium]